MAEIDKRTKQDILTALKARAASYTPEWHFDEKEPDIAAVLAMTYADMAAGTCFAVIARRFIGGDVLARPVLGCYELENG